MPYNIQFSFVQKFAAGKHKITLRGSTPNNSVVFGSVNVIAKEI
jgi:hypothetical protein